MKAYRDQHFLIDPHAVERIANLADVKGSLVLEIGPGTGHSPVLCLTGVRW